MKPNEAKDLARSLAKLFPGSMANDEQGRQVAREFLKYEVAQVRKAIDEQHRTREFVSFPELYKACELKAEPSASTTRQSIPDQNFADVIRQQRPDLAKRSDHEVILRFWRSDWFRYKFDADRRLKSITDSMQNGDVRKRLIEKGATEEEITTAQANVLDTHNNNENGYQRKVESQCRGCLLAAKMDPELVNGWVETLFADADHFRVCLSDLRGDIFAPSAAP